MITYTWKITGLKIKDVDTTRPSAVVQTYWKKTGVDENGNEGVFSGATPFTVDPTDESGPFIPFNELSEDDIISWIKSIVVGNYEEHVNSKIAEQIEQKISPVTEGKLPWLTDTTPADPTPVVSPV